MFVLSLLLTRHRPPSHPGGADGECVVRSCAVHGGGIHQREARHRGEHPAGNRLHQQGLVRRRRGLGCTCAVELYTLFSLLPAKAVRSAWCCLCGATQRSIWMVMGEFRQCSRPLLHALSQHSRGALCGARGMTSSCLCTTGALL